VAPWQLATPPAMLPTVSAAASSLPQPASAAASASGGVSSLGAAASAAGAASASGGPVRAMSREASLETGALLRAARAMMSAVVDGVDPGSPLARSFKSTASLSDLLWCASRHVHRQCRLRLTHALRAQERSELG
jgi:hypothetical protein